MRREISRFRRLLTSATNYRTAVFLRVSVPNVHPHVHLKLLGSQPTVSLPIAARIYTGRGPFAVQIAGDNETRRVT